jgi:hypothetical protein
MIQYLFQIDPITAIQCRVADHLYAFPLKSLLMVYIIPNNPFVLLTLEIITSIPDPNDEEILWQKRTRIDDLQQEVTDGMS